MISWFLSAFAVLGIGLLIADLYVHGVLGFKTSLLAGCAFSFFAGFGRLLFWGTA